MPSPNPRAFTLIELLVVVTIIAILIALMVPALDQAVEQAQRVVCASQQRSIQGAAVIYAQDNRKYFFICRGRQVLPAFDKQNPNIPHGYDYTGADAQTDWLAALASVGLATPEREPVTVYGTGGASTPIGTEHRPTEIWECPSTNYRIIWDNYHTSYWTTYSYYGGVNTWWHGTTGQRYDSAPSPRRLSNANGGWVLTADNSYFNGGSWGTPMTNHPLTTGADAYGLAGSNQSHIDGSVQWIPPHQLFVAHTWMPNAMVGFLYQVEKPTGFQVTDADRATAFK